MKRLALSTVSVLALVGCVPLPFVTPPMKVEGGAAWVYGPQDDGAVIPLRAGLHLLQMLPDRHDRTFDVAPGWGIYPSTADFWLHGPYLEAGALFPSKFDEEGWGWRWGVNAKAHYLFSDQWGRGYGATLQGTIEWTGYVTGPFAECHVEASSDPYEPDEPGQSGCSIGVAEGEGGIGLFVETSYAQLGDMDLGWSGGGLIFRAPASLGIMLVPIWE